MCRLFLGFIALLFALSSAIAQTNSNVVKLGVLDFGATPIAKLSTDKIRSGLRTESNIQLIDPDLSATAARGVGYSGSLNMSTNDARDLGAAMDVEFYLIGDAQTLRRSSSNAPVYYESYCSVFLISARSGRLVFWIRPHSESANTSEAEEQLQKTLSEKEFSARVIEAIKKAQAEESKQRRADVIASAPLIEEAPDDDKTADAQGLRLPRLYRRLRPAYPETAALVVVANAMLNLDEVVTRN